MNALFNLKETSKQTGVSRATIYRFYERNPELWDETVIKTKKRLIPESHLNKIVKSNIYAKALAYEEQIEQLKRLVKLLKDPNTTQYRLYQLDWDWFGTIAFKNIYEKEYCFHSFQQAFYKILDEFGLKTDIRIFFTVEPFTNRKGCHIHFILSVSRPAFTKTILDILNDYFKGNRIEIVKYDPFKAGIYYISKNGMQGIDWDILGNNLDKIGLPE